MILIKDNHLAALSLEPPHAVGAAVRLPVWVGSGLTPENLASYAAADGFIVGSSLKTGGLWSNPLDPLRAAAMASAFAQLPDKA